jgi:DNA invertase Pin-like site-specific DNA recombinase
MPKKETLYIYCRVSSKQQAEEGYSLESQRKAGIKKAESLGMNYELFIDAGISAKYEDITKREKFYELMKLIRNGKARNVFVTEWSRLSRNDILTAYIKNDFKKHNIKLYVLNGLFDLNDEYSELIASIVLAVASFENKLRVSRLTRGKKEAAKAGKWQGGIPNYGYRSENGYLVIDEKEAAIYKRIVDLNLNGMGMQRIANQLNAENIPTKKREGKWNRGSISKILKNPVYKGEARFNNEIINTPAIIDETKWNKIQANFEKNAAFSKRKTKRFYMLRGILYCNKCGRLYYGNQNTYACSRKMVYGIKECSNHNIKVNEADSLIWNKFIATINNTKAIRDYLKKKFESNRKNLDKIKKTIQNEKRKLNDNSNKLERLLDAYIAGKITDALYDKKKLELENESANIAAAIASKETEIEISENEKSAYDYLIYIQQKMKGITLIDNVEKKQKLLQKFIKKIEIDYLDKENKHVFNMEFNFNVNDITFLSDGLDINDNDSGSLTNMEEYGIQYDETDNLKKNAFSVATAEALG